MLPVPMTFRIAVRPIAAPIAAPIADPLAPHTEAHIVAPHGLCPVVVHMTAPQRSVTTTALNALTPPWPPLPLFALIV